MASRFIQASLLKFALLGLCTVALAQDSDDSWLEADRKAGQALQSLRQRQRQRVQKASAYKRKKMAKNLGSRQSYERLKAMRDICLAGERFIPHLSSQLESRNGYAVRFSVVSLGRIGSKAGAEALLKLYKDPRCTTPDRFYSLCSLAQIADPERHSWYLEQALTHKQERSARAAEVGALRTGGDGLLKTLAETALKAKKPEPKARALAMLERIHRGLGLKALKTQEMLLSWAQKTPYKHQESKLKKVYGQNYICWTDLEDNVALRGRMSQTLKFRQALMRWLMPGLNKSWVTHIRLFKKRHDFDLYGACHEFNFIYFTEFYYSALHNEIVAFQVKSESLMKRRLQHEIGHDLIENVLGGLPPWLAEGLCECFEVASASDGAIADFPVNRSWLNALRRGMREGSLPKLEQLLTMDHQGFYGQNSSQNYACAWSFLHFLIQYKDQSGARFLRKLMKHVRQHGSEDIAKQFKGSFQASVLERPWRAYLKTITR